MKLSIDCPIRDGVVIITKKQHSVFYHCGIVAVEKGIPFVFHADPDNKNNKGGCVQREVLKEYLKDNRIREIYDACITREQIYREVTRVWGQKYDHLNFTCEHFIREITGQRLKRGVFHSGEKVIIGLVVISAILIFLRAIIFIKR